MSEELKEYYQELRHSKHPLVQEFIKAHDAFEAANKEDLESLSSKISDLSTVSVEAVITKIVEEEENLRTLLDYFNRKGRRDDLLPVYTQIHTYLGIENEKVVEDGVYERARGLLRSHVKLVEGVLPDYDDTQISPLKVALLYTYAVASGDPYYKNNLLKVSYPVSIEGGEEESVSGALYLYNPEHKTLFMPNSGYVYDGAGLEKHKAYAGEDCSSLISYISNLSQFSTIHLERTFLRGRDDIYFWEDVYQAFEMFKNPEQLQVGDVFVWSNYKDGRRLGGHTGLFLGKGKEGGFIIGDAARVTNVFDGIGIREIKDFNQTPNRKLFFLRKRDV